MTTCNPPLQHATSQQISLLGLAKLAFAAKSQRRALLELDADALDDLGLTVEQAKSEANRPFWDVPASWRAKNR
jgi:uncharacterized protein YjiS (DUF1127 family)